MNSHVTLAVQMIGKGRFYASRYSFPYKFDISAEVGVPSCQLWTQGLVKKDGFIIEFGLLDQSFNSPYEIIPYTWKEVLGSGDPIPIGQFNIVTKEGIRWKRNKTTFSFITTSLQMGQIL